MDYPICQYALAITKLEVKVLFAILKQQAVFGLSLTHVQGQVYVTGQGDSGQLGLGPRVAAAPVPTSILFPCDDYNIVYITAGIAHNSKCYTLQRIHMYVCSSRVALLLGLHCSYMVTSHLHAAHTTRSKQYASMVSFKWVY